MATKELGRQYEPPKFNKNMQHDLQPTNLQPIKVNTARQVNVGDVNWKSRLMHGLSNLAQDIGTKYMEAGLDRAYLDGVAQADVKESEDELESNILTKDWVTAGYRDTRAKVALANITANFPTDLKELRTKTPEEFNQYLTERRNEFLNEHSGLSLSATEAIAGQLILQDKNHTQAYTTERFKYITNERLAGYSSLVNVQLKDINTIQDGIITEQRTADDLRKASVTLGGTIHAMWEDPSIPLETKQENATQIGKLVLANNAIGVYDYLNNEKTPSGGTLLSQLTPSQQLELSNAAREARNRTADIRNFDEFTKLANLKEAIKAGQYVGTQAELDVQLKRAVANGMITGSGAMEIQQSYAHIRYQKDQDTRLANYAMSGDIQSIINAGKTPQEAVGAIGTLMQKQNVPIEQQISTYMGVGAAGIDAGYKEGGKLLGISVQAMQQTQTPLPQHQRVFTTIAETVTRLEKEGRTDIRPLVLSGVPEEQRTFVESILYKSSQGVPLQNALTETKREQEINSSLSPSQKAAMANSKAAEREKAIDSELGGRGVLRSAWLAFKSIGSSDARDRLKIMPFDPMSSANGIFGDSENMLYQATGVQSEVRAEADRLARINPELDTSRVMSLAYANVANRLVSTEYGPVVLPKNIDVAKTFGIAPGNQAALGPAISGLLPKSDNNSFWRIRFQGGSLYAYEYTTEGQPLNNNLVLTPDLIRNQIRLDTSVAMAKSNKVYGSGDRVTKGGMNISFTGENVAGIPGQWAYEFRQNIIRNESAVPNRYKDTLGNDTEGVGILSKSPYAKLHVWQNGKITSESASRAFMKATDDAMQVGQAVAKQAGVYNIYGVQLLSELAYHSGLGYASKPKNKQFIQAMSGRDYYAAEAAFKKTRAYEVSGGERKQHYLSLIEKAFEERRQW